MDRYDELLKKARQEMVEPEHSHESVFDLVWQGVEKGLFDGMRRGFNNTRRPIGAPVRNLSTQAQKDRYRQVMDYQPPAIPMVEPRPDVDEGDPVLDADSDPVEAGLNAMRRGPEGSPYTNTKAGSSSPYMNMPLPEEQPFVPQGPEGGPEDNYRPDGSRYDHQPNHLLTPPPLPPGKAPGFVDNAESTPPSLTELKPTAMRRQTLVPEGMESQYPNMKPHDRAMEAGLSAMQDTPPSMRMRQASPEESARMTESGQEMGIVPYGHNFDDQMTDIVPHGYDFNQLPQGNAPLQLPAPREKDPVEEGMKQLQLPAPKEEAWSPTLGESGTWGGHKDHFNPKTQKLYGKRSKPYGKYQNWSSKQTGKAKESNTGGGEETSTGGDDDTIRISAKGRKNKKKGFNMPQLVDNETKQKPTVQGKLFPETETPTDDESNKQRQEKRAKDRETGNRPGLLEGLVTGGEEGGEGGEDWPTSISQSTTPRDVVDAMYEAAQMGDEKALSSLRNNQPDAEKILGMDDKQLDGLFKNEAQWQNADLSLLPSGLLKHIRNEPQQADADYSLLPRGWQEGVAQ